MSKIYSLNSKIDHSILGPNKTSADLLEAVRIAKHYQVASVCCNPDLFQECIKALEDSNIIPCTVIDFPHGTNTSEIRIEMVRQSISFSARPIELDIVVSQKLVEQNLWSKIEDELLRMIEIVKVNNSKTKLIFETCYRSDLQIIKLCEICAKVGVNWVKTSTGFAACGASIEQVQLMRASVPEELGVKASGGIKTYNQALELSKYCSRLGMSATEAILEEEKTRLGF